MTDRKYLDAASLSIEHTIVSSNLVPNFLKPFVNRYSYPLGILQRIRLYPPYFPISSTFYSTVI